jgi:predicted 3-demethylubiquinone-9 3-methyltransferase (glyoxalase superfamily)
VPGLIKAIEARWPRSLRSRCWALGLFTRGLAAARQGAPDVQKFITQLQVIEQCVGTGVLPGIGLPLAKVLEIQRLEIAAVTSAGQGSQAEAIALMEQVVALVEAPPLIKPLPTPTRNSAGNGGRPMGSEKRCARHERTDSGLARVECAAIQLEHERENTMQPITPCLWFDHQAEEAAEFYTSIFRNATIGRIARYGTAGREVHGQPPGTVMTVAFELNGQPFNALNGGPVFKFNEAISLQVLCETQEEIDYYWERLSTGGDENAQQCGWLKDKYGVSWHVVPTALSEMASDPDSETDRYYACPLIS